MPTFPITNISPSVQYVAAAGQTAFVFPFYLLAATDLAVYSTPAATQGNDVRDLLILTTNYTVNININNTGGTVTLVVPATLGRKITIVRLMPPTRLGFYVSAPGALTADGLNTDFESEVLMIQQSIYAYFNLTPSYNFSATVASPRDVVLPVLAPLQSWRMNAAGTAMEAVEFDGPEEGPENEILDVETLPLATQADVARGTSEEVLVTPLTMGSHRGMIAAQAIFGAANNTIVNRYYYGITGIQKISMGQYEITFDTPFETDIYGWAGSANMDNITAPQNFGVTGRIVPKERLARTFRFWTVTADSLLKDFDEVNITFTGQIRI